MTETREYSQEQIDGLAKRVSESLGSRRRLDIVCESDDVARRLADALKAGGFKASAYTGQLWNNATNSFETGPCVRVSKKRGPSAPKKWDPFPRNDPLRDGPGCRRMPKDAWEKAGLSDQDRRHALRILRMIDDFDADDGVDSFKAYDIARVLKAYRERYEAAEAVREQGERVREVG